MTITRPPGWMRLNFPDDHPMAPKVRQLQKVRAGIQAFQVNGRQVSEAMLEWERDLSEEIAVEAMRRGFTLRGFQIVVA